MGTVLTMEVAKKWEIAGSLSASPACACVCVCVYNVVKWCRYIERMGRIRWKTLVEDIRARM